MMTNLFSSFDPATSPNMSLNWTSIMMSMMILPTSYWIMPNKNYILMKNTMNTLMSELKMTQKSKGMMMMLITLFMFIMMNNLTSMLPYMFNSTSHLSLSLSLSLPMWLSTMMYGWANKSQKMFAHLIPNGTPAPLMPLMVLIETTSNLIRPGSLAVRLMANMIAGHLLMTLLGESMSSNYMLMMIMLIMQMMLMLFEMAVCIIQSYVFSMLMTLYSNEVN